MDKPLEICVDTLIVAAALEARRLERQYNSLTPKDWGDRYVAARAASRARSELRALLDFKLGELIEPEPVTYTPEQKRQWDARGFVGGQF